MKILIGIILIAFSLNLQAEEICSEYKSKIEDDHQWHEIQFNEVDAMKALKRIEQALQGKIDMGWMESKNLYTQIEGYRLKIRYLRLKKQHPNKKDYIKSYKEEFCSYIKSVPIID